MLRQSVFRHMLRGALRSRNIAMIHTFPTRCLTKLIAVPKYQLYRNNQQWNCAKKKLEATLNRTDEEALQVF